jgi:ABC-type multidrug transport system ATPase subunit
MPNFTQSINLENISLIFNQKIIFEKINLIKNGPGLILFTGENGAGKSSLLKIASGFLIPTEGAVFINNLNPFLQINRDISFLGTQNNSFLTELTGEENLKLLLLALNKKNLTFDNLVKEFEGYSLLNEILEKKVCDMSRGMLQSLSLIASLGFGTTFIFLDEPFSFLSDKNKEYFKNKIEKDSYLKMIFITQQESTGFERFPDCGSEVN